ncbi:MAG: hypothetical protein NTW98_00635, partial [Candidatus Nomurabacteria bacterium]|nr:hypothetical protein [Candidatus Nomurabacteria bacterium]
WLQGRLHRNDKSDIWLEQPTSWYGGLTFYLSEKSVPFRPTCDTCGYWGDIPGGFAFHADAFFGVQHRIFKKKKDTQNQHFGHSGVFGFFEGRYDWYNSQNQRGKFLGKENIKTRFGLRIKAGLPPKLPFLRSAQVDLGPQATTYNTPNNTWVKAPLPFTKGAKGVKLNDSKTEVFSLQNENNRLLAELKQDPSVWGEFQENQKKLNRAERKLARRED